MGCYQFGVTGKVKGGGRKDGSRGVRSARLWVYKMRDANDAHGQTLRVYELSKGKTRRLTQRSLVARLDTHVQEGWVSFDVSRVVRGWQHRRTPASLQMLAIRCGTCHRTNYRSIFGVKVRSHCLSLGGLVLVCADSSQPTGEGGSGRQERENR